MSFIVRLFINTGLKDLVMDAFIDPEAGSSSGGKKAGGGIWSWLSRL